MSRSSSDLLDGARVIIPTVVGLIPFGLICGAVCEGTGMPDWGAVGFSVFVFAGASQLAAIQLMADHASTAVVILTGLVINLRMVMYSASIAPHFQGVSTPRKGLIAYLLTDQGYAMALARYDKPDGDRMDKVMYYLGAGMTIWVIFIASTMVGTHIGALIPPEWDLEFAVPLVFIAVVVPAIRDRAAGIAAIAAVLVALLADGLPYNLGLMAGALCGILTGYVAERRQARD